MAEFLDKPIFIVACPRSGTTILASILNSHSQISTATETHFFNYISKQKKYKWENLSRKDFELIIEESRIVDFYTLSKITKEELIESFGKQDLGDNPDENKKLVFNLLMDALLKKKNKQYFCDKTPQHLLNVEEILRLYPRAKFIHLVRDGRDTVNSLVKMPWRPEGILNNSRFWKSYIKLGLKLEKRLDKSSFMTVRYEDLLKNPEEIVRKVCDFIGVNFEAEMLSRSASQQKNSENIFSEWESSWKHKSLEEIDSTRVGAWTKELSLDDQMILNWHQRKNLLDLGYEAKDLEMDFRAKMTIVFNYIDLFVKKLVRLLSFAIN